MTCGDYRVYLHFHGLGEVIEILSVAVSKTPFACRVVAHRSPKRCQKGAKCVRS
jgi:hypothetical protein